MTEFETVIGLEVHLQLNTQTKIFCGCRNAFGAAPNTHVCPVCLGLPGSLPVLNRQVLADGIKAGLALNCEINPFVKFDRKNYYYPDLPKGYQISQYDFPIARQGHLMITQDGGKKKIGITRAHLEEDAGKLVHDNDLNVSLVDYNRTGTPLIEIVSEPDMRSPEEAYEYLVALKLVLLYLDISDCDMEKGSLRCDANVSIRPKGASAFGTKAEIKNMNSFRAVKSAIACEVERQTRLVLSGGKVVQETRLWDEARGMTSPMRSKEEAHDYRYFPEPDLVPFTVGTEEINAIRKDVPELPFVRFERFLDQYRISPYDARIIIQDKGVADFFEACVGFYSDAKKVCHWINGPLIKEMNERKRNVAGLGVSPKSFTDLVRKVDDGVVSNLVGKDILTVMIDTGKEAGVIIQEKGLAQVSDDSALENVVDEVIAANPDAVAQVRAGKASAMGFFVGQAMKRMQGKANPKKLNEIIQRRLQHD